MPFEPAAEDRPIVPNVPALNPGSGAMRPMEPLLEYEPRKPTVGSRSARRFRAAVRAHFLASYAVGWLWLAEGIVQDGIGAWPLEVWVRDAVLAPLMIPLFLFLGLLTMLRGMIRPIDFYLFPAYAIAFALAYRWLVRRDRRRAAT